MAPALMVCWIEGGAVNFLFSVLPGGAVELPGRSRPAPGVVDLRRGQRQPFSLPTRAREGRGGDDGAGGRREVGGGARRQ